MWINPFEIYTCRSYPSDGKWLAHCLNLDIFVQGDDSHTARLHLIDAVRGTLEAQEKIRQVQGLSHGAKPIVPHIDERVCEASSPVQCKAPPCADAEQWEKAWEAKRWLPLRGDQTATEIIFLMWVRKYPTVKVRLLPYGAYQP